MASFNRLFLASGEDGVKKERKPGTPKISSLHYEKLSRSPHQYREFTRGDVELLADIRQIVICLKKRYIFIEVKLPGTENLPLTLR